MATERMNGTLGVPGEHWNAKIIREAAERDAVRTKFAPPAPTVEGVPMYPVTTPSAFVTKDSGARAEFESGMVRDTQDGKPRFDLVFPEGVPYAAQLFTRIAELMARGAEKYEERNWEQADSQKEIDRMRGSALRHCIQWYLGETDEDHAAAVYFNIQAAETTKWKMEH